MTDGRDKATGKFGPGNSGRPRGSRNKLQASVYALCGEEWDKHGAEVMRFLRADKPDVWAKLIFSAVPKEVLFSEGTPTDEMSDEELEKTIAVLREMQAKAA
jgi:hypothetical protein